MPLSNLDNASSSNMTLRVESFSVDPRNTDAATGMKETEWINSKWSQYLGYYKEIPELKSAIDMRAVWALGKGFKADNRTTAILNHIQGYKSEGFNRILKNMIITKRIGGDSFAEIIRDEEGLLLNLKPLDPGTIKIVVDKKGMIKRYEQMSKTGKKELIATFQPEEIFHLTNKRIADEIHGVSDIECVEKIILANAESFADMKELMHRYVRPKFVFKVDSDDQTKINAFAVKMDAAVNKGENIYIPKDTVEFEIMAVPANATLNPAPWRDELKAKFYQSVNIPQILMGGGQEFTEANAKIAYLAFQQSVEDEQHETEADVLAQLNLEIELDFPATIQNELISDYSKDGQQQQTGFQPADTSVGVDNSGK